VSLIAPVRLDPENIWKLFAISVSTPVSLPIALAESAVNRVPLLLTNETGFAARSMSIGVVRGFAAERS